MCDAPVSLMLTKSVCSVSARWSIEALKVVSAELRFLTTLTGDSVDRGAVDVLGESSGLHEEIAVLRICVKAVRFK